MSIPTPNPSQDKAQERRAFIIAIVFLVAIAANLALSLSQAIQTGAWQHFVRAGLVVIFGAATITAAVRIRRGRVEEGIWLIIRVFLFTLFGTSLLLGGFGLILALIELVLAGSVTAFALPKEKKNRSFITIVITALLTFGVDLLPLSYRVPAPAELTQALPVIAGIVILILLVVFLRQAWQTNVNLRLLSVIFLSILTIVFFLTMSSINLATNINEENERQSLAVLYADYNEEVESQKISSLALSDSFADRQDIKDLYLANNREALLTLLTPIFDTLKNEYNIRHLYIEDTEGKVFVRIHNPEKFGDDVTYRLTAAAALEQQATIAGVEVGPNRIGIRSVSPLLLDNEFIGMLEIGLDYDQSFVDSFKARHNADYNLWLTYDAAESPGLSPADDAPLPPTNKVFYYAGTNPISLPIEQEVYDKVLETGKPVTQFVTVNEQEWAVIIAPMLGYGNRTIGIVEILKSRTDTLAAIAQERSSVLLTAILLAIAGLASTWFTVRLIIMRPISHLFEVTQKQVEGDLSARISFFPPDEFGDLGRTFNNLSEQLSNTLQGLEQRVADRTRALETSTEVSRRLSTILDQGELAKTVVNELVNSFGYYYAHIYRFEGDDRETLHMKGGTGEAGRVLLARGHTLQKGQGLVGRAAETNSVVLVNDTLNEDGWLPNELLPETRSEIAVPIAIGEEVLGVFDVQHNELNAFSEEDAILLQALANQIAIAAQNAQAYEDTQRRADREALMANIAQEIQGTTSMEDALKVAVRELGRALDTDTSVKLD